MKIALVGNPNVGKSVIFNYLTGIYADVSNYPGTTIDISNGELKLSHEERINYGLENQSLIVIDTPGVYGISSFNEEEIATRDLVIEADYIVNVVSSISLSRDLFLTKQLADMGKPMIVVLNQFDEAELRKVKIDIETLSANLGLDFIKTVATKSFGLTELKEAILASIHSKKSQFKIRIGKISKNIDELIKPFAEQVLSRGEAVLIAEADGFTAEKNQIQLNQNALEIREKIYQIRRDEVNQLIDKTVSIEKFSKRAFLGRLLMHPLWGALVAITILYLFLYQFLGKFIAGSVVELTEVKILNNIYVPFIKNIVTFFVPIKENNLDNLLFTEPLAALGTFLAGDYGVLTLTVTYLYGLLMPLVIGFYFGLAILEDTGYLPRLAVLTDGVLSKLGMNGRAIIPLILGGGCVTMAVVTTRLLTNKKEKLITMALLGLTIPCSAQLGVIQGLLSNIGGFYPWFIWAMVLMIVFGITGILLNKLVPGTSGNFISDIPPLRIPAMTNVIKKTLTRSKVFLDEATPAFFYSAAILAAMQILGILASIINFFEPLIHNLLLLPKEVTLSFILGMIRRDFGAFGLLEIPMNDAQLITACVVLTLFVPCIATVAVMIKEKNLKTALLIWLSSWILAFGIGYVLARVLNVIAI